MECKYKFTLIELLITLSLLSLVGGMYSFQLKPMIEKYRYNQQIHRLHEEVLFSKRIAEIEGVEVICQLKQTSRGLVMIRNSDEPLSITPFFKGVFYSELVFPSLYTDLDARSEYLVFTSNGQCTGNVELMVFNHSRLNKNRIFIGREKISYNSKIRN